MQRALFHRAAQLCVLPRSLGMQDPCPGISCCASVQRGPRPYTQTDLSVQAHIGRNASPRRQHWFTSAFIRLIGPGYNAGVTLNEDLRVRALLGFSSCLYLHIYTRLRHSAFSLFSSPHHGSLETVSKRVESGAMQRFVTQASETNGMAI